MPITAQLEHVNVTVRNAKAAAETLCSIFDWKIRWSGPSLDTGYSVHVGTLDHYLALFTPKELGRSLSDSYTETNGLNHIGVVVDDLDAAEKKVIKAGYHPKSYYDYEPGRRFYFEDDNGIEFEVISYAPAKGAFRKEFMSMLGSMSKYAAVLR